MNVRRDEMFHLGPAESGHVGGIGAIGCALVFIFFAAGLVPAATNVTCPHVTAVAGWQTTISLFGATGAATYRIHRYDAAGALVEPVLEGSVTPPAWTDVLPVDLGYEGIAVITSNSDLLVKVSYQYNGTPSVCEFFLSGETKTNWVLPNAVRSWMDYSGLASAYSGTADVYMTLTAYKDGVEVASNTMIPLPRNAKFAQLSTSIWSGLPYGGFDTVKIAATSPIQAPLSITGNLVGERHLFFAAKPLPFNPSPKPGDLLAVDGLIGNLRYIPAGAFLQGSPTTEISRGADENQYAHILTTPFLIMETEVTRQMWADLRGVQPSLLGDPSDLSRSPTLRNPVQYLTWNEAVLFANTLSLQNGLTPCYYKDVAYTLVLDATNYNDGDTYCLFDASGFRLPTEGEWEFACRAGTITPFSTLVPTYAADTSNTCSPPAPGLPTLYTIAWMCFNSTGLTRFVAMRAPNPWGLYDMHGNVREWCQDWYNVYPTGIITDYRGTSPSTNRSARGGSWNDTARILRSAARQIGTPTGRGRDLGFRLVRRAQP